MPPEAVPSTVKRSRGRPKGSFNKPKDESSTTASSPGTSNQAKPSSRCRKEVSSITLNALSPSSAYSPPLSASSTPFPSSSSSSSSSPSTSPPPPLSTGNHSHTADSAVALSGGLKWALGIIVLILSPRVVGGAVHRLTGGRGGHHPPRAFHQNTDKNLWANIGRFLTGIGGKAALTTAVASIAVGVSIAPPGTFQLYHTVGEIPALAFREQRTLVGRVVRVSDGDTIRVRHTPLVPLIGNTPDTGRLTEETLIVRLAGIDAPETAKGRGKGQPFAEESKRFVTTNVLDQRVEVKLLSRDQYARAVCSVSYGPFSSIPFPFPSFMKKDLSSELLKEGLAVVYRQRGAQYDGKYREMEMWEAQAKMKRKGIWSKEGEVELPHQYKARTKIEEAERTLTPRGA